MEKKTVTPTRGRRNGNRGQSPDTEEAIFEKNYMRYIASNKGLGKIATKKAISTRIVYLVVTLAVMLGIYLFGLFGPIPAIFVYPFILIVLVIFTIPVIYLILRSVSARKKFRLLSRMVKKFRYEKNQKAFLIRKKGNFYTFLVYDENFSDETAREEVKRVQALIDKKEKKLKFSQLYNEVDKLEIVGKLRLTDFSTKIIDYTSEKSMPLIQVSFKTGDISSAIVTGYITDFNFILFPPTVWKERPQNNRKKVK